VANILIDGYNLMGIFHKNLEKARNDLIQKISGYANTKNHNIVLVFDGQEERPFEETKDRKGNTTVIYSSIGEKADHVIKNIIASSAHWIVVSSDREISTFAERHGSVALKTDEFENKLYLTFSANRKNQNNEPSEDDELGLMKREKKGNPKKLSKKDKRKKNALNKL